MNKRLMAFLMVLLAVLVITLPAVIRLAYGRPFMAGEEPYYNARIASYIKESGVPVKDELAGRDYRINPYHLLLAAFAYLLGIEAASFLLPVLLGLGSLFLFNRLLKSLGLSSLQIFFSFLVLLLSPASVTIFSSSYQNAMIAFLFLLGFWLYLRKGSFALSIIAFAILSLFGITHALSAIIITFIYSHLMKGGFKKFYALFILMLIVIITYSLPLYLKGGEVAKRDIAEDFISDFGGILGFSIFMLILAPAGMFILWAQNKRARVLLLFTAIVIAYSIFNKSLVVYSNFILSILSGTALSYLTLMRWKLSYVRAFTLIILWCGLAVSLISHIFLLGSLEPSRELSEGLRWLKENSLSSEKVFSHYSKGFWIQYFAERPAFIDPLFESAPDAKALYYASNSVFQSNDLKATRDLLTKHDIIYLVITQDMYKGLVWDKQAVGLSFLLQNNETFKNLYNNSFVSIFKYIK